MNRTPDVPTTSGRVDPYAYLAAVRAGNRTDPASRPDRFAIVLTRTPGAGLWRWRIDGEWIELGVVLELLCGGQCGSAASAAQDAEAAERAFLGRHQRGGV